MGKSDFTLSFISLLIVLIGAIAVCCMKSPAGLFLILPTGMFHVYRLYRLVKEKHEN